MSKLMVLGNCYGNSRENADKIFKVLEENGFVLGYNENDKNSATILEERVEEEEQE